MREAAAVSALALTLGLTLRRPLLTPQLRVGPGLAAAVGVALLFAIGGVGASDVGEAVDVLWRPFIALASIMVLTGVAARVGVMDQLAALLMPRARSAGALFRIVFVLSLGTAAVLNDDAAILLLTPVVVVLVRRLFPGQPALLAPFAFAVFMAAGVAPFVTSNPMNTVIAGAADIDFNEYAGQMVPVALAGSVVSYLVLRRVFARVLSEAPAPAPAADPGPWAPAQRQALALVLAVLVAYPVFALLGLQVWVVAAAGAAIALALAWRHRAGRPLEVLRGNVAWDILAFLLGMFVLAQGLQNAGAVEQLTDLYAETGTAVAGVVSAVGSALINNHSMALTNLLAIEALPGAARETYLAALIGGDLGPRLLPIGSLAGLLWLAVLRGLDVEVSVRQFVVVGAAVTVPSLAVSLAVLAAL
jgi:arsenical pump membrane protein